MSVAVCQCPSSTISIVDNLHPPLPQTALGRYLKCWHLTTTAVVRACSRTNYNTASYGQYSKNTNSSIAHSSNQNLCDLTTPPIQTVSHQPNITRTPSLQHQIPIQTALSEHIFLSFQRSKNYSCEFAKSWIPLIRSHSVKQKTNSKINFIALVVSGAIASAITYLHLNIIYGSGFTVLQLRLKLQLRSLRYSTLSIYFRN